MRKIRPVVVAPHARLEKLIAIEGVLVRHTLNTESRTVALNGKR